MAAPAGAERCVVQSPLGAITLRLPAGAELVPDPGVSEGTQLWWDGFTLSFGAAGGRSADTLLALERSLATVVAVDTDGTLDAGDGTAVRELRLGVETRVPRHWTSDETGRHERSERVERERLRFRFWSAGDRAVRAGYRVPDGDVARLAVLDGVLDSVRVGAG